MRFLFGLSLLCLLCIQRAVFARIIENSRCEIFLSESSNIVQEPGRQEVAQLIQIALESALKDADVNRLLHHLAEKGFKGIEELSLGSGAMHLRNVFLQLSSIATQSWIAKQIQTTLAEKLRIERVGAFQREELIQDTRSTLQKMEFVRVPGGEFWMGEAKDRVKIILTNGMHVMTTKVTQHMWEEFMLFNPSQFKGCLNNPIENITWWSAVEFANRVSKKFGLKPVWDISKILFRGSAEEGTLEPVDSGAASKQIRIDSGSLGYLPENESNIYESEGFRFGTDSEKGYLLRDLGRSKGKWPFGIKKKNLARYAWFHKNSEGITHPVGTTELFFTFYGTQIPVYDLVGNAREWGDDYGEYYDEENKLSAATNPRGVTGFYRVVYGGGWLCEADELKLDLNRVCVSPGARYFYSVRLLRTAH